MVNPFYMETKEPPRHYALAVSFLLMRKISRCKGYLRQLPLS